VICFLDFETTGTDVFKDNPIEIGAVLTDNELNIIAEYHSLIAPRTIRKTTRKALSIHGISRNELESQPTQKQVLIEFFKKIGTDYRFACWNMNFDISFFRRMCHLNNEMINYNKINYRHLDLQSIVSFLKEKGVLDFDGSSLSDLTQHFSISRQNQHSAFEDAKITLEVYRNLMSLSLKSET